MSALPAIAAALPFFHRSKEAAAGLSQAEIVAHALEGWHEFYLMAGTAAVTLVGLLFVALSFHLDTLLHDHRAHLLHAARLAFSNFVYVLMLSLFFLIPDNTPRLLGIATLVLSVVMFGSVAIGSLKTRRRGAAAEHERFLQRRYLLSGFMAGVSIATALMLVTEPRVAHLYMFVAVVCAMLANAAGMSWDLLVQVGRLRRSLGETPKA